MIIIFNVNRLFLFRAELSLRLFRLILNSSFSSYFKVSFLFLLNGEKKNIYLFIFFFINIIMIIIVFFFFGHHHVIKYVFVNKNILYRSRQFDVIYPSYIFLILLSKSSLTLLKWVDAGYHCCCYCYCYSLLVSDFSQLNIYQQQMRQESLHRFISRCVAIPQMNINAVVILILCLSSISGFSILLLFSYIKDDYGISFT